MPHQPIDLEQLSRELTDHGRLIEAGWIGFKFSVFTAEVPPAQMDEMRNLFFAGAQHLFSSIITVLDAGDDPTDADLRRMDMISAELKAFIETFAARHLPTKGSA